MEDSKAGTNESKTTTVTSNDENPTIGFNSSAAATAAGELNAAVTANGGEDGGQNANGGRQSRTPFTNLSQVDADLALARTLQEQERAYMMIRMNGGDGSDSGSWETGSYVPEDDDFDNPSEEEFDDDHEHDHEDYHGEEDAFDVHAHAEDDDDDDDDEGEDADDIADMELNPADFPDDEAYARALQDAEDMFALSGLHDMVADESMEREDTNDNSQYAWEEVDPDELSYEELIALGDVVGTESRGLSADTIASLPTKNFKMQSNQVENVESCVICRLDYEDGDTLTVLSCKHSYHSDCINNWLNINKVCPVCSAEVSTSGNSKSGNSTSGNSK